MFGVLSVQLVVLTRDRAILSMELFLNSLACFVPEMLLVESFRRGSCTRSTYFLYFRARRTGRPIITISGKIAAIDLETSL